MKSRRRISFRGWLVILAGVLLVLTLLLFTGLAGNLGTSLGRILTSRSVTATLPASFELNGSGLNIDSIALWEAPNPEDTLLFITARDNSLVEIWRFPFVGNEQPALRHESFGTSQVNGVAVEQQADLLFVSISSPADTVVVFSLPDLEFSHSFVNGQSDLGSEPGIAVWSQAGADAQVYVNSDSDQSVYIYDGVTGREIDVVGMDHELEMMLVDEYHEVVYIPDETGRRGILAYDPSIAPYYRNGRNAFGGNVFQQDAEGIVLFRCQSNGRDNGQGFIVVSDQRKPETDIEFFDRQSWEHLGTLHLDGVANTDGLGSTQIPLPGYPTGLLTAINDDTSVVGIGWDTVLSAMQLRCQVN